ncbi:hypothetical protein Tco_0893379 [Tanacetum coccineum]|uniref:Uncharacterized protein n=1 Tax=Tanacetum coccineum TaxID=301880 RepID=A0ABQ5CBH0_9ASTR
MGTDPTIRLRRESFPTFVDWRINALKDEMPVKGLSRRYFLGDDVHLTFLNDNDWVGAPNPTKVKTGTRPRAAHEVPLLTATANRVIVMEDATVASGSSGTPCQDMVDHTVPIKGRPTKFNYGVLTLGERYRRR